MSLPQSQLIPQEKIQTQQIPPQTNVQQSQQQQTPSQPLEPELTQNKKDEAQTLNQQSKAPLQSTPAADSKSSKQQPQSIQKIQSKDAPKPQTQKIQPSNLQLCQQFFANYNQTANKQIRSKIIFALNSQVISKLPITHQTLYDYLQHKDKSYSLLEFKEWVLKHEETHIQSFVTHFKNSKQAAAFTSFQNKLKEILTLVDHNKSSLNLHIAVGQSKGKTVLKYGARLTQNRQTKFQISLDIKTKKKQELRSAIEKDLKSIYKSADYHLLKLCKISFTETEKTLKITLLSQIFEEFILAQLIELINHKLTNSDLPVFKLEGELNIKNSVKADQNLLTTKKFVKWMAEGASTRLHIEANPNVVKYLTFPLADLFPIFKIVHSGQINLKLRTVDNVDKFFQKLGINELCDQTPSLSQFLSHLNTDYLEMLPFVTDILRRTVLFASNTANEKLAIEVEAHVSALQLNLTLSSETCKQLSSVFSPSLLEQFS